MAIKTEGEIVVIGCGGCGITIAGNLRDPLEELGDGFSNIRVEYIDSSLSNIKNFSHDDENFHLIKATGVSKEILGSGGERKENSSDIVESVKEFIDKKKFNVSKISTYYVVIASASGGTGSVISPMVVKNLLERDLPVIAVLVGDSSNGLSTINTLNTIASFNAIAKATKKPLSIIYNDNAKGIGENSIEKLESIDREIFKNISVLSMFLSGQNTSLDQKDMAAFIDQSVYKTIGIKPGLYGLNVFPKEVNLPDHLTPTVGRTITVKDVASDIGIELFHHKFGTTENSNVINTFRGQFPIHVVSYANSFSAIEFELKTRVDSINEKLNQSTVDDVTADNSADDDGLVF